MLWRWDKRLLRVVNLDVDVVLLTWPLVPAQILHGMNGSAVEMSAALRGRPSRFVIE